jgi:hypothetical protein
MRARRYAVLFGLVAFLAAFGAGCGGGGNETPGGGTATTEDHGTTTNESTTLTETTEP